MSKNFTISELIHSDTADAKGFTEQYSPTKEVTDNLNCLADVTLQPARDEIGEAIIIDCGYRCERVNEADGGVSNSQHLTGEAADTRCSDNKKLFNIYFNQKNFDQLIWEENGEWVHVSYKNGGIQRNQALSSITVNGFKHYAIITQPLA